MSLISCTFTSKYSHLGDTITKSEVLTGDSLMEVESSVDGSEDDLAVDFSISDPTLIKGLYMVATTDMEITPKNLATSAATVIELSAGTALMWTQSSGVACPFDGADVAKLHVANLDADAGQLTIRCLKDGTPLTS